MTEASETQQIQPEEDAPVREATQMIADTQATQMAISVACPICKTENPPGEQYCVDCGFLLSATPVETEMVSEEAPAKLTDKASGREFALRLGENTVGRQDTDVLLMDGTVSRKHAKLTVSGGKCLVEDLGSSNGTFVDGAQLQPGEPVEAASGAEIKFGSCVAQLVLTEAAQAEAPAAEVTEESAEETPEVEEAVVAPEPVAKLVSVDGTTGEFAIVAGENTVGRRGDNRITILGDPYVSGSHAVIIAAEDGLRVTDLGSTNGTLVNGDKLAPDQPVDLHSGDEVVFGQTKFRLETTPAAGDQSPDS